MEARRSERSPARLGRELDPAGAQNYRSGLRRSRSPLSIYLSIDPSPVADLLLAKSLEAKPLRGQRLRKSFEASSTAASTASSSIFSSNFELWRFEEARKASSLEHFRASGASKRLERRVVSSIFARFFEHARSRVALELRKSSKSMTLCSDRG